ncbi:MAG TPA: hypothetical protein DCP90_05310 [Clostridiales bacterium]|nr:MAG: hypothetical protein A2Y22_08895 [Clostridiales bacterium GWD2_32_59]HAN10018.1 hypothetical protein [Clostridiales bacterium]
MAIGYERYVVDPLQVVTKILNWNDICYQKHEKRISEVGIERYRMEEQPRLDRILKNEGTLQSKEYPSMYDWTEIEKENGPSLSILDETLANNQMTM